jgi:hypothetical protein
LEIFGKTCSDCPRGVFSFFFSFRIIRAITRDPDVYPEPEAFKPERFLNPSGTLRDDVTLTSVFGFGKRVCPGRHYVDATLFIVAATVLSVFRIEKRCDSEGAPFHFTYSGGLVRCVEWFLFEGTSWRANCYCFTKSSESVSMLYQSKG